MALWSVLTLFIGGCSHGSGGIQGEPDSRLESRLAHDDSPEEGVRIKGGTVSARINALIANGEFAQAEALIAEATASGLISQPQAAEKLQRIALLSTRVGQLPASLQRAKDFPSQLKDYTLFEIKQMLQSKNFSLATEAQLKMVKKLLEDPERVMEKTGTVR